MGKKLKWVPGTTREGFILNLQDQTLHAALQSDFIQAVAVHSSWGRRLYAARQCDTCSNRCWCVAANWECRGCLLQNSGT